MSKIEERVQAGMILLDEIRPGWEQTIDLERLALQSCARCVIGQLAGEDYERGLAALLPPGRRTSRPWPIKYGFALTDDESFLGKYPRLTDEWRRQIRARVAGQARAILTGQGEGA